LQSLFDQLTRLLVEVGPWIVFAVTFAETAFFIGLLIPAEATILVAAFMAEQGYFSVVVVWLATFMGGLLGDQAGYLLGRYGGGRLVAKEGRIARVWALHEPRAARLFRRHASLSVSLARFLSFVRTLMPWFAGMTKLSYPRFLVYDILGVLGWSIGSVLLGYLAGESWERAAHALGRTSAIAIGALILIAGVVWWFRRGRAEPVAQLATGERVLRVALTGNVASGKSTVVEIWKGLGARVIDADVLARAAVAPGTPGHAAVVHAFGDHILAQDGSLNRAALRGIVFADSSERTRLEAIVHPEVARLRTEEEKRLVDEGARIIINDIPLLFEVGLAGEFDAVVHVHADEATRLDRLVQLRGLSEEEARALMEAQMPSDEKRPAADFVIENSGTRAELEAQAQSVWEDLQEWSPRSA
jgi:dephospho-CoA kinase